MPQPSPLAHERIDLFLSTQMFFLEPYIQQVPRQQRIFSNLLP